MTAGTSEDVVDVHWPCVVDHMLFTSLEVASLEDIGRPILATHSYLRFQVTVPSKLVQYTLTASDYTAQYS